MERSHELIIIFTTEKKKSAQIGAFVLASLDHLLSIVTLMPVHEIPEIVKT